MTPRFSIRFLLYLILIAGCVMLIYSKRDPWRMKQLSVERHKITGQENIIFDLSRNKRMICTRTTVLDSDTRKIICSYASLEASIVAAASDKLALGLPDGRIMLKSSKNCNVLNT